MMERECVFISNSFFSLAQSLQREILSSSLTSPQNIILTAGHHSKHWLLRYLSDHSPKKGCFGFHFFPLAEGMNYFLQMCHSTPLAFPKDADILLYLEKKLLNVLQQEKNEIPHSEILKNGSHQQLFLHVRQLAKFFMHYSQYGDSLPRWLQNLWESISCTWPVLAAFIKREYSIPRQTFQIFIFNIPHIPKKYRDFLDHLSHFWKITYFFRSPTMHYWGDILSSQEIFYIDKNHINNKRIKEEERQQFYELVSQTNFSLANFGKLAKSTFAWLSEKNIKDSFHEPSKNSNLIKIRRNIFSLSPNDKMERDTSIAIHCVPNRMQEIKVLVQNLEALIAQTKMPIEDIVILIPDINLYANYIQFVFAQKETPFGYILHDVSWHLDNPHIEIINIFLALVESRWEIDSLKKFLFSRSILQWHHFSDKDVAYLSQFFKKYPISWGWDITMKEEFLKQHSSSPKGTWSFAIQKFLESVPFAFIEQEELESLSKWFAFLNTLFHDLHNIKLKELPLPHWIEILKTIFTRYFPSCKEASFLVQEMEYWQSHDTEASYSFQTIRLLLQEILSKESCQKYMTQKPAISFFPLSSAGTIGEVQAIYILGLDEDSFPRKEEGFLSTLQDRPLQENKDLFSILEALLSAKHYLYISYIGTTEKDGSIRQLAFCIQKLFEEIQPFPIHYHANHDLHEKYFCSLHYSQNRLSLAQIYHQSFSAVKNISTPSKNRSLLQQPDIYTQDPTQSMSINIQSLIALFRHPIHFYCRYILGIDSIEEENQYREFFLSPVDKERICREIVGKSEVQIIQNLERHPLIPEGIFQKIATQEILQKIKRPHNERPSSFLTLYFDHNCKAPFFLDLHRFIVPAPTIYWNAHTKTCLEGKVPCVSREGIHIYKKYSLAEVWKHIPHLMALQFSPFPCRLIFQDRVVPEQSFAPSFTAIIEYYQTAITYVSPLLPNVVEPSIKKGEITLCQDRVSEGYQQFWNNTRPLIQPDNTQNWYSHIQNICNNLIT